LCSKASGHPRSNPGRAREQPVNAHARARLSFVKSRLCRSLSRASLTIGHCSPSARFLRVCDPWVCADLREGRHLEKRHERARRNREVTPAATSGAMRPAMGRRPRRERQHGRRHMADDTWPTTELNGWRGPQSGRRRATRPFARACRRATAGTPSRGAGPVSGADKKTRRRRRKEATSAHRVLYTRPLGPFPGCFQRDTSRSGRGPKSLSRQRNRP
jgi:hypothetical protein